MIFFYIVIGFIGFFVLMFILGEIAKYLLIKQKIQKIENENYINNAITKLSKNGFNIDKKISIYKIFSISKHKTVFTVLFDNKNDKIAFINAETVECFVFSYEKIKNFELMKNNQSEISSNTDKAILGSVLFGTTGAIIGASGKQTISDKILSLEIIITVNDFTTSQIIFNLIEFSITNDYPNYNDLLKQITSLFSQLNYVREKVLEQKNSP